jgi:hypothetical protein
MDTINITFTVDQINGLLNVLGDASYVKSAQLIALIQEQGTPQFQAIQATNDEAEAAVANATPVEASVSAEGNF